MQIHYWFIFFLFSAIHAMVPGSLIPVTTLPLSGSPRFLAISTDGRFLAVSRSGIISIFSINKNSGLLTSIQDVSTTSPGALDYFPGDRFLANAQFGQNISMYCVNPETGIITEIPSSPFITNPTPLDLKFSPDGRFLANTGIFSGIIDVSVFSVDMAKGNLTSVPGSPFTAEDNPVGLAYSPDSKFLTVVNEASNNITVFSVNQTTGSLQSIQTIATPNGPVQVSYNPDGRFLGITNQDNGIVRIFSVNQTTGILTEIQTIAVGGTPAAIQYSPNGSFLAVTNVDAGRNDINIFSVNQSTGLITEISGSPFSSSQGPFEGVYSPDGRFFYVVGTTANALDIFQVESPGPILSTLIIETDILSELIKNKYRRYCCAVIAQ